MVMLFRATGRHNGSTLNIVACPHYGEYVTAGGQDIGPRQEAVSGHSSKNYHRMTPEQKRAFNARAYARQKAKKNGVTFSRVSEDIQRAKTRERVRRWRAKQKKGAA
jgi:hypothetical protein